MKASGRERDGAGSGSRRGRLLKSPSGVAAGTKFPLCGRPRDSPTVDVHRRTHHGCRISTTRRTTRCRGCFPEEDGRRDPGSRDGCGAKGDSGHPGMPMGMADISVALWKHHLRHNPVDPLWPDRDRFILSNGHGSMLQYALLHLTGYDLPMKELENFASSTPRRRATPSSASRRASRPPPARWGRASPTPSAWRSPSACSPRNSTSPITRSSTTGPTCTWATVA